MSQNAGSQHDVIVVGAGPGGSACAAFLARAGLDVLLVDKASFPRDKTCGDAVSAQGVEILDELGLGGRLRRTGFKVPALTIVSPSGHELRASIPAADGLPRYGIVVKRLELDEMVLEAAEAAGSAFADGVHVRGMERIAGGGWTIHGDRAGTSFSASGRIVVMAVGASLPLMRHLHLVTNKPEYAFAARAYYEDVAGLDDALHIHFDGVPLPGYGWIFPVSESAANVGAGYFRQGPSAPPTAAVVLDAFLDHPPLAEQFRNARRLTPVKGFPIRTDFHRSECLADRLLVVGEAAGLVNPFTGEGIDYALESARIAAHTLIEAFEEGDLSSTSLGRYERTLRRRFQTLFRLTHLMRRMYMTPTLLDPLVLACATWPDMTRLLISVLLSYESPIKAFAPTVLWRILLSSSPFGKPRTPRRA
jgi:geranylgeranyl reductase family protein